MKERAFNARPHEVRAILAGTQTQTRRVLKEAVWHSLEGASRVRLVDEDHKGNDLKNDFDSGHISCPYGQPGDRLYVRETWAHYQTVNDRRRLDGGSFAEVSDGLAGYRADGHETIEDFRQHVRLMSGCDLQDVVINGDRWRPSTHMPRWASRIDLEVTGVRVERLNDISEADAMAEGVESLDSEAPEERTHHDFDHALCSNCGGLRLYVGGGLNGVTFDMDCTQCDTHAKRFRHLWQSINGTDSWAENPWVWCVEFKRVKP